MVNTIRRLFHREGRRGVMRRVQRSALYRRLLDWRVGSLTSAALRRAYQTDEEYQAYLAVQIQKSYSVAMQKPGLNDRTVHLVGLMRQHLPTQGPARTVLCVGCRNGNELDYVQETCGVEARGLDLFSEDPRIQIGDMHSMPFADGQFDALYSCHNLEHAYDLDVALREFVRVTRAGGLIVIEVPVHFEASATDRWDIGSAGKLVERMGGMVGEVLVQEEEELERGRERKRVARVLVTTSGAERAATA